MKWILALNVGCLLFSYWRKNAFGRDFEYYFFSSYTFFNRNALVVLLFLITPIFWNLERKIFAKNLSKIRLLYFTGFSLQLRTSLLDFSHPVIPTANFTCNRIIIIIKLPPQSLLRFFVSLVIFLSRKVLIAWGIASLYQFGSKHIWLYFHEKVLSKPNIQIVKVLVPYKVKNGNR